MDWCAQPYEGANHHPVAVLNQDKSDTIIRRTATAGAVINLDASQSHDPAGDELVFSWWQYQEAGTYAGQVFVESPQASKARIHIPTGAAGNRFILSWKSATRIRSPHFMTIGEW